MGKRKTKIVCTIGPASGDPATIEGMIKAGMDVARLNFSHGSHRRHAQYIRIIREVAKRLDVTIAILQDLPGPKLRIGNLREGRVRLREGAELVLTTREVPGDAQEVYVNYAPLPRSVKPGDEVFLDDGALRLQVQHSTATDVHCVVTTGGTLRPEKGVSLPGIPLDIPSLTDLDKEHLLFGIEQQVDFVALSFVRKADDVLRVREILNEKGVDIPIIAKVEKREALDNIDELVSVADALMVARGDLGVETPLARVPLAQKEIIQRCNQAGKPVITATQMLESMVKAPRPTRAEVTDVSNAIFEGTDAVMLSEETAVGRYPQEAVAMMSQIALETEAALPYERILWERGADLEANTEDAISYDACHTAHQLGAAAILAYTTLGSTALRVAKYRPKAPILALTPKPPTQARLMLSWGVYPVQVEALGSADELFTTAKRLALETGLARSGDLIVVTAGTPLGRPGTTNLLKVEKID